MLVDLAADPMPVARLRWGWARETDSVLPDDPDDEFIAAVRAWTSDATRTVWTAGDGDPVGMVCLTEYTRMPSPSDTASGRWGYLGHLYVRPDARGDGVGEALVRTVVTEAAARGYARVVLSPSVRSIPLYRRCGFTDGNDLMVFRP